VSVSADRLAAVHLLVRVEDGAYASRLLASMSGGGVRTRVLGVLRWQRRLDHLLDRFSRQPVARLEPPVRAAMRIGLFEAVHLGVPNAVATDAAVHLVRHLGRSSARGLVNAVLRRAVAVGGEIGNQLPADLRWSHPEWLARRWQTLFGDDRAAEMMAAAQEPARLWARFLDDGESRSPSESVSEATPHPWCPGAWSADSRVVLDEVRAGRAYVQDPSSQVVGLVAQNLAPTGGRIVDLCAAPGGKASQLAARGPWAGSAAADRSLGRVRLMRRLLEDMPRRMPVVVADASRPSFVGRFFDFVLLDAPCTGTGTLRRHPELRWRLDEESPTRLATLQGRLLAAACDLVADGGALLYSTCSIEPEENEHHFSADRTGFGALDLGQLVPEGSPVVSTASGGIRLLPSEDGDGFTLHAVRRGS